MEKPTLSPNNKDACLAFYLQYLYQNWVEVVFTDESYFEIGPYTGNVLVECYSGQVKSTSHRI